MFEISNIGVAIALMAGVVSFLSSCILPLVPGYISYVAGKTLTKAMASMQSGLTRIG